MNALFFKADCIAPSEEGQSLCVDQKEPLNAQACEVSK